MGEPQRNRFRLSANQLFGQARCRLKRLSPERAHAAVLAGALLIDIRSEVQRERDGVIPGSRFIAPATLQRLGLIDATDVVGGFQAWKAAGLPREQPRSLHPRASDHE
jgi:rhodanese-related sulfurtransferase